MAPEPGTAHATLEPRWTALCHALGVTDDEPISRNWAVLEALYAHPPRAYHNLHHIADCLRACDAAPDLLPPRGTDLVRLALFFHDCIYDAQRHDNEARSAAIGAMIARDLGLSDDDTQVIRRLVMATRHVGEPASSDEALIRDIDLASLGADPATFDANTRAIREEFAWASDERFRTGRLAFFQSMLARTAIYTLPHFRDRYEVAARTNIARAIAAMSR